MLLADPLLSTEGCKLSLFPAPRAKENKLFVGSLPPDITKEVRFRSEWIAATLAIFGFQILGWESRTGLK